MDPDFLTTFKPDGDSLLRRFSKHIDDPTLEHIAALDPVGGRERRAEILGKLRTIRDEGIVPCPLKGDEGEVLDFSKWSEPDVVDRAHRSWEWTGAPGHWARAFSCSVLMRAYGDEDTRNISGGGYDLALIQLLESLKYLKTDFEPEAMAMVAWFIPRIGDDWFDPAIDERVFAGIGLLSLAANYKHTVGDATIVELTEWLLAEEKRAFEYKREPNEDFPKHWLLRATFYDASQTLPFRKWITLGAELAAFDSPGRRGDAVRDIGRRMSGETPEP